MTIASAGPQLDKVEIFLRSDGQTFMADALLKLQQDAGVAMEIGSSGLENYSQGGNAGKLLQTYESVTPARLAPLKQIAESLPPDNEMKGFMNALVEKLPAAPAVISLPVRHKVPKDRITPGR